LTVLRDAERFSSDGSNIDMGDAAPEQDFPLFLSGQIMLFSDPPDHTRLRRLANYAFAPRAIEGWRPRVRGLAQDLLRDIGPGDTFDVMDVLARPLPVLVIAELLGVPVADQDRFAAWSLPLGRMIDPNTNLTEADQTAAMMAAMEFVQYFNALIDERRDSPRDDVLSALIAAEEEGDRLSHDELLINLILLLIAGHETTSNLIGNGTLALCNDEAARDEFAAGGEGLARTAVDELLRYDAPVQFTVRNALERVDIHGVTVEKGRQVITLLAGANRDPDAFEAPEQLMLTRSPNNHLAFSNGIHFCLGAMLARMEGQEAFPVLLDRAPKLARSGAMSYRPNMTLRGLAELQVTG
jgi:cytochrome P450